MKVICNIILKGLHCLLTAFLFFIVCIVGLLWLFDNPHPHYHLYSEQEISKGIFLYVMDLERDSLSSDCVDYFLSDHKLENPAKMLMKESPFFEINQRDEPRPAQEKVRILNVSLSQGKQADEQELHFLITFSGRIDYFKNKVHLNVGGKSVTVKISLFEDYPSELP